MEQDYNLKNVSIIVVVFDLQLKWLYLNLALFLSKDEKSEFASIRLPLSLELASVILERVLWNNVF